MGISANLAQNSQALSNAVATPFTFRNRVINGNCNLAQRTSLALANGVTGGYGGPDRFTATNGGGGQFTQSQGSITYNGMTYNAVVQTVNTANTTITGGSSWSGLQQRIEGYNCYDLLGEPVAMSFIFNTNVTGTYSVSLTDTATYSYVTTINAIANVPQKVVVTMPPVPLGASIPNSNAVGLYIRVGYLNTGTFQTSTLNTWIPGTFAAATGATNWGLTAGNFIALTQLQLEEGVEATPFELRPASTEFSLCFRYYQTVFASTRFAATATTEYNDSTISWQTMRVAPTAALLTAGTLSPTAASATMLSIQPTGCRFEIVSNAAGDCYAVQYYYSLSAEI